MKELVGEISKKVEILISAECENNFNQWRKSILMTNDVFPVLPDGVREGLDYFISQQKHRFFRDFKEKIQSRLLAEIEKSICIATEPHQRILPKEATILVEDFVGHKNRLFLESFIRNKFAQRQAAMEIGVPKSTFNDWLFRHEEYVVSEVRKTIPDFKLKIASKPLRTE